MMRHSALCWIFSAYAHFTFSVPPLARPFFQLVYGVCISYSRRFYEILGVELGSAGGLTTKSAFCRDLLTACAGQIAFKTYSGKDYARITRVEAMTSTGYTRT